MRKTVNYLIIFSLFSLFFTLFFLSIPIGYEDKDFGPFYSFTNYPERYSDGIGCYDENLGYNIRCIPEHRDSAFIIYSFLFIISLVIIFISSVFLYQKNNKLRLKEDDKANDGINKNILLYRRILFFSLILLLTSFLFHFRLYWHASADLDIFITQLSAFLLAALTSTSILSFFKSLKNKFSGYLLTSLLLLNCLFGFYYLSQDIEFFSLLSIKPNYITSLEAMSVILIVPSLAAFFFWMFKFFYNLNFWKTLLFFIIGILIACTLNIVFSLLIGLIVGSPYPDIHY